MSGKVLMIGLAAEHVDFVKWPELTLEKLERSFVDTVNQLNELGYTAEWCLTDTGQTAAQVVRSKLMERRNDVVVIGAGVRKDPDHLLLFETIINTIIEVSPWSRIAFNTLPFDTPEAVQRWISR